MFVWLASYPRSGNTLVRQVLEAALGVLTYTVYRKEDLVGWPGRKYDSDKCGGEALTFIKTHSHDDRHVGDDNRAFYIVRDGRDALVSHAHYETTLGSVNRGRPVEVVLRELVDGGGRWNWSNHVERWHERQAPHVTLRFEELVQDPNGTVQTACRMFGIGWPDTPVTLTDFATLHNQNPSFYRSGKVGQWRKWFDDELHERFWEVHGNAMRQLGYRREFDSYIVASAYAVGV